MQGLVISGSRNVFTVKQIVDGDALLFECRIKGKILKSSVDFKMPRDVRQRQPVKEYNPLAPGDIVEFENAQITFLHKRRNAFVRLNSKGNIPQILGANIDLLICVTSISNPPFRPRFIDRVLLQADYAGIQPLVLVNKSDLYQQIPQAQYDRLNDFERQGYNVLFFSCKTKKGFDELLALLNGKTALLCGQSGVGKSSILNLLFPGANLKTGELNEKYDRGNHTTVMSKLFEYYSPESHYKIIDTPGIRQFIPYGITKDEVILYMRDFAPFAGKCGFGQSCTHQTEEGCKIKETLAAGIINADRFESFSKMLGGL
ncbi:MAG: ribosome small subunit-dependent GTPase A [Termitinemataceae bacterium]|nr:MAG: ribosome small subunit-dependent GTPase A [Termitinemataceae bacterium]